MTFAAAWILSAALTAQTGEETYPVTLAVKSMHCEECKATLDARLKPLAGVKTVETNAEKLTVTVTVLEKHAIRLKTLQACVPGDMKLERVTVTLRGVVSAFGMMLQLKAKASNAAYELGDKDPKNNEKQAALRESLGQGRKKFKITGELVEREKREVLAMDSFEAVEWKD
jgi:copper chaperone CopZ